MSLAARTMALLAQQTAAPFMAALMDKCQEVIAWKKPLVKAIALSEDACVQMSESPVQGPFLSPAPVKNGKDLQGRVLVGNP